MKRLSKILPLLVSGTFLMASPVSADPDRDSNRGRILEQSSRDCSHNRNCRPSGGKAEFHNNNERRDSDYADNRRPDGDRDRNQRGDRDRDWDRHQRGDRDHDRHKPRIEFRFTSSPAYRDIYRRPYYGGNRVLYRAPVYVIQPRDYYRDYNSRYPDPNFDYAPDGSRIMWNDSRQQNNVMPRQSLGQYCREYYKDVVINGRTQQVFGTACRQPDGSWEIQN